MSNINDVLVLIPTKGRLNKQKTSKLLNDSGINHYLLLEPEEYETYPYNNKINIGLSNKGIAYVRNFAIEYSRSNGKDWLLMIDDDISSFGIVENCRIIKSTAKKTLEKAFSLISKFKKPLSSIEYSQFGWSAKEITENRFCEVCVFLYLPKIKYYYDNNVCLKEDRDFSLQNILYNEGTLRYNWSVFSCPKTGSNKGGLYEEYKSKINEESSYKMQNKYPGIVEVYDKNGIKDIKVNWSKITKK